MAVASGWVVVVGLAQHFQLVPQTPEHYLIAKDIAEIDRSSIAVVMDLFHHAFLVDPIFFQDLHAGASDKCSGVWRGARCGRMHLNVAVAVNLSRPIATQAVFLRHTLRRCIQRDVCLRFSVKRRRPDILARLCKSLFRTASQSCQGVRQSAMAIAPRRRPQNRADREWSSS